jgi:hypothetical protein
MADTCQPGLQGFPIRVEGWVGTPDKSQIIATSDIQLQFSPSETPMKVENGILQPHGTNTFFMGGIQYTVATILYAEPTQQGIASFSGTVLGEFQIWGSTTTAIGLGTTSVACLLIPIIQTPAGSFTGTKLANLLQGKAGKLVDCIPQGEGADIVRYSTCIETDKRSSITIQVAYWTNAAAVTQDQVRSLPQKKAPAGIPKLAEYKVLSSFTQLADEARTKSQRQYTMNGPMLRPYPSVITVNANSREFQTSFRLIQSFSVGPSTSSRDIGAYKCIAIDRQKDIQGGKLLIDPKTGERMDENLKRADEQGTEDVPEATLDVGDIFLKICIVLGILLGITVLAAFVYFINTFLMKPKEIGLTDYTPGQSGKGSWFDTAGEWFKTITFQK